MKDLFPEYYRPSEEEFKKLWQEAIFVFDANVLLNIYRFTPDSSEDLLKAVGYLADRDRIWIPFQFAHEYHRHMEREQVNPPGEYIGVQNLLDKLKKQIDDTIKSDKQLKQLSKRTRLNTENWDKRFARLFNDIKKEYKTQLIEHTKRLEEGNLQDKIANIFEGKVGNPYEIDELKKAENRYGEIKKRYQHKQPPGYMDIDKESPEGDCIGLVK